MQTRGGQELVYNIAVTETFIPHSNRNGIQKTNGSASTTLSVALEVCVCQSGPVFSFG